MEGDTMKGFENREFETDLISALAISGGEVSEDLLLAFLEKYFGGATAPSLRATISGDLTFFRSLDPASASYSEAQILSVRRGMAAIAAHRIFQSILKFSPEKLYNLEVVAKHIQKDTNVEIHPSAEIGVPMAIDHGHGTVIGATAKIGKSVFIYHGVTLGASKKRSKTQRRHPHVGDRVFFGNGSQVLGPAIVENDVKLGATVLVRDCLLEEGCHLAMGIRVAGVIVPRGALVFGYDAEDTYRYWVRLDGSKEARWVTLGKFEPENRE